MDTTSPQSSNAKNGLTFGLIIGLIYCISLFARFNMTSSNPIMIGAVTLLFYLIVIGMLFFCVAKRRKELGGYIDLKNAFQTIFIAVLIAEAVYIIFNFIYLKFIDPGYFDKLQIAMENYFEKDIKDEDKRDEMINRFKETMEKQKTKGLTIQGLALSYLISVAITGVFGFFVALIMRKRKQVFELDNQS